MNYFMKQRNEKRDDLGIAEISRNGRVRKKSSKFVDFESTNNVIEQGLKRQKTQQFIKTNLKHINPTREKNSIHQRNSSKSSIVQYNKEFNHELIIANEEKFYNSESRSSNEFDYDDKLSSDFNTVEEVDPLMLPDEEIVEKNIELTRLEAPKQSGIPTATKTSLYMSKNHKNKIVVQDNQIMNKSTTRQNKNKGRTKYRYYNLWADGVREQLLNDHPELDGTAISKQLDDLWASVHVTEKTNWKKRAENLALKLSLPTSDNKILQKTSHYNLESANIFVNNDESTSETVEEVDPLMLDDDEKKKICTELIKLGTLKESEISSQAKSSLNSPEKNKKKLSIKDDQIVNQSTNIQENDKTKKKITCYNLWFKHARKKYVKEHPNLDRVTLAKRLGQLWSAVPDVEKNDWKNLANGIGSVNLKRQKRCRKKCLTPPPNMFNRSTVLEISGISRSGRVIKKSSRLVDSESSEKLFPVRLKRQKSQHSQQLFVKHEQPSQFIINNFNFTQNTNPIHQINDFHKQNDLDSDVLFMTEIKNDFVTKSEEKSSNSEPKNDNKFRNDSESSSELSSIEEFDPLMLSDIEIINENTKFTQSETPKHIEIPMKSNSHTRETYENKLVLKDDKIITKSINIKQKDNKTKFTSHNLCAKDIKQQLVNGQRNLDDAIMSKQLDDLWSSVHVREKYNWKKRASRFALKRNTVMKNNKTPPPISHIIINKSPVNEKEFSDYKLESVNEFENNDKSTSELNKIEEVDPLKLDNVEIEESTGFTKLESSNQLNIPSETKNLDTREKYRKQLVIKSVKNGKVINKCIKTQQKDKGKIVFTAYMLWAKDVRKQLTEHNPHLDFATISKGLRELWATVPVVEKNDWNKRAQGLTLKTSESIKNDKTPLPTTHVFINKSTENEKEFSHGKLESSNEFENSNESTSESIKFEEVDPLMLSDVEIVEENTEFTKFELPNQSDVPCETNNLYTREEYKKELIMKDNKMFNKYIKLQEKNKNEIEILYHLKNLNSRNK